MTRGRSAYPERSGNDCRQRGPRPRRRCRHSRLGLMRHDDVTVVLGWHDQEPGRTRHERRRAGRGGRPGVSSPVPARTGRLRRAPSGGQVVVLDGDKRLPAGPRTARLRSRRRGARGTASGQEPVFSPCTVRPVSMSSHEPAVPPPSRRGGGALGAEWEDGVRDRQWVAGVCTGGGCSSPLVRRGRARHYGGRLSAFPRMTDRLAPERLRIPSNSCPHCGHALPVLERRVMADRLAPFDQVGALPSTARRVVGRLTNDPSIV